MDMMRERKMTNQSISDEAYSIMEWLAFKENMTQGEALELIIKEWYEQRVKADSQAYEKDVSLDNLALACRTISDRLNKIESSLYALWHRED